MKTPFKLSFKFLFQAAFLTLFVLLVLSSCKKSSEIKDDDDKDSVDTLNYIPKDGINYHYTLISEDGELVPFYKRISGHKDSLGVKLSDVTTYLNYEGEQLTMRQKMYSKDAFTFTAIYKADQWERFIQMLRSSLEESGDELLEVKTIGFPFYMIMENQPRIGSALNFTGALEQKLYIKVRVGSGDDTVIQEIEQTITRSDGKAVKSEFVEVPAGRFDCFKYEYSTDNRIVIKIDGVIANDFETHDFTQVWVAPRIGDVKTITQNSSTGTSTSVLTKIGD